ncbi:MAG: hypothetical protein ACFFGZ_13905 [Candidatus Thorarchaeota archaeon]
MTSLPDLQKVSEDQIMEIEIPFRVREYLTMASPTRNNTRNTYTGPLVKRVYRALWLPVFNNNPTVTITAETKLTGCGHWTIRFGELRPISFNIAYYSNNYRFAGNKIKPYFPRPIDILKLESFLRLEEKPEYQPGPLYTAEDYERLKDYNPEYWERRLRFLLHNTYFALPLWPTRLDHDEAILKGITREIAYYYKNSLKQEYSEALVQLLCPFCGSELKEKERRVQATDNFEWKNPKCELTCSNSNNKQFFTPLKSLNDISYNKTPFVRLK